MIPLLSVCIPALASIGFIAHLLRKSPEGWEDSGGFHYREEVAAAPRQQPAPARARPVFSPAGRAFVSPVMH